MAPPETSELRSSISHTAEALSTATPDTPTQQSSYSTIAESLPRPNPCVSDTTPQNDSHVSADYTVANNSVQTTQLPFGTPQYDSWYQWRSKYATIAALYVLGAEFSTEFQTHEPVHVMFSPPQERVQSQSSIQYWRTRACEIAQEAGICGGVATFHGFRIRTETADRFSELISDTEYEDTATDVLEWEWIRKGNWRQHVRWGPHIHIIGLTDGLTEYSTEGIMKKLRSFGDESSPIRRIAAHRAVAKDMVDHLTFHPERALPPLSWFGKLQSTDYTTAKQYVTNKRLNEIREILINSPSNPDTLVE